MDPTRPPIDPGHPDAIEEIVFELLERFEDEGEAALQDLCDQYPALADRLRERVAKLRAAGLLAAPSDADATFPERLGDFHLLERIGGGGMGVVYLAEQTSLGRRVALKLIRPEHLYFSGARERFQREVRAVARLAHPGIAPVFTVGQEDGVPFFAMELVDGASIAEVLVRQEGRAPQTLRGIDLAPVADDMAKSSPVFEGTWVQACVRVVRQIAEALEHAHRNGVLHRDVKPSNVMLTGAGRALLVDFGLATSEGTDRITRTGTTMGSTPYLPPEVVAASNDGFSAVTDVYALGVSLYEMLTLHLPFDGGSRQEIGDRILDGRPAAPRSLNPAIPEDLETVCLVAMDPEPDRRYPTCEAFARDLTNVLELRPIEARRAGPWLRLRRWVRRSPARAAATALTVLVVVGGPILFGVQQAMARRDLEKALGLAEENFAAAQEAVQVMLESVGDKMLADIPRMETVRRELLERALAFYRRFADARTDDPALRLRIATAADRACGVLQLLGESGRAEEMARRALAMWRTLAADGDPRRRVLLARSLARLAGILAVQNGIDEAATLCAESTALLPEEGADAEAAATWSALAEVHERSGRIDDAVEAYRKAIAGYRAWADRGATSKLRVVALTRCRLSQCLQATQQLEPAEREARAAVDMLEELQTRNAGHLLYEQALGDALTLLANVTAQRSRPDDAIPLFDRAISIVEALARDFPRAVAPTTTLQASYSNLAILHAKAGRFDVASGLFEKALEMSRSLAEALPESADLQSSLGASCANVAGTLANQQRYEEAADLFGEAVDHQRKALAANPDNPTYRRRMVIHLDGLMGLACAVHRHAVAAAAAREFAQRHPRPAVGLVKAAKIMASCSSQAASDSTLAETYAADAIDMLQRAVAAGTDRARIAAQPWLQTLRDAPTWDDLDRALRDG